MIIINATARCIKVNEDMEEDGVGIHALLAIIGHCCGDLCGTYWPVRGGNNSSTEDILIQVVIGQTTTLHNLHNR